VGCNKQPVAAKKCEFSDSLQIYLFISIVSIRASIDAFIQVQVDVFSTGWQSAARTLQQKQSCVSKMTPQLHRGGTAT